MRSWMRPGVSEMVLAAGLLAASGARGADDPEVTLDPGRPGYSAGMARPGGSAAATATATAAVPGRFTPSPALDVQDPRPFANPMRPGFPSHPPGARYRWPGGLFYRDGHHWRRPPISPRYFDFHRIAPRTQHLP